VLSSRQKARRVGIWQLYAIRSSERPPQMTFKRMSTIFVRSHCFHVSSSRVSPVFLGQIIRSLFSETCSETCCFDGDHKTITADSSRFHHPDCTGCRDTLLSALRTSECVSLYAAYLWIVSMLPRANTQLIFKRSRKEGTLCKLSLGQGHRTPFPMILAHLCSGRTPVKLLTYSQGIQQVLTLARC
jgi:hypothetical protein